MKSPVYKHEGGMTAGGLPSSALGGLPEQAQASQLLMKLRPLAVVQAVSSKQALLAHGDIRYTMHPLIREIAVDMLKDRGQEEQTGTYAAFSSFMLLKRVEELIRMGSTGSANSNAQQLIIDELANIRGLASKLIEVTRERATVQECFRCCQLTAAIRHRECEMDQTEQMQRAEIEAQEKALGAMHIATVPSLSRLVATLQAQRKLSEAESMQQHIVTALQKESGAHDPAIMRARAKLAEIQEMRRSFAGHKTTMLQWLGSHLPMFAIVVAFVAFAVHLLGSYGGSPCS